MPRMVIGSMMVAVLACLRAAGQAPQPPDAPSADSSQKLSYTLKVYSREVLTDVSVTDKNGNPVTGLTEKDFLILDNGKPQQLASFDEHREQTTKLESGPATPGVFSNSLLRHPPPQVNALLFDTTTIQIVDQMYLFQQMKRFVESLPPGEPVAVFTRWGDVTLQLSAFTDDHAVLLTAIKRAIPKLQSTGAWMANDMDTLRHMMVYLNEFPGRKNLLWFTSGSNLFLNADANVNPRLTAVAKAPDRRAIYDALETERIAIYPIDPRGLMTGWPNPFQQMLMRQDAEATGGQAFMNTNGLAQAANHVVSTDGYYYTLTYSPHDLKNDGNWRRVEVKLDQKGYEMSYRRGYYDDGSNQPGQHGKTRTMLVAGAKRSRCRLTALIRSYSQRGWNLRRRAQRAPRRRDGANSGTWCGF